MSVERVSEIYAALGRDDMAAILDALSPDVDWFIPGPPAIPSAGRRRGREEVRRSFEEFAAAFQVEEFRPSQAVADGDTVLIPGSERLRVQATGAAVENDWLHAFKFRDGLVVEFRAYEDTHALWAALAGRG